jgi:hypothetical protein
VLAAIELTNRAIEFAMWVDDVLLCHCFCHDQRMRMLDTLLLAGVIDFYSVLPILGISFLACYVSFHQGFSRTRECNKLVGTCQSSKEGSPATCWIVTVYA